jgi:hypothetical protein
MKEGGLKLTKNTMRGKNIVRMGGGGSKLFELYSPIGEIIMKGLKLFEPYLQVAKDIVKGLKLLKPFCIRTDNFETKNKLNRKMHNVNKALKIQIE